MDYRVVRPDEVPVFRQFASYSFSLAQADMEPYAEHMLKPEHLRFICDEHGQAKASMALFPYQLQIDGAKLAMGGVAWVASPPEHRRGGWVGGMLVAAIAEMKERGMPLSALYPFKQSFYRRYGWEVASATLDHEIPLELLAAYRKGPGVVQRWLPAEEPLPQLLDLYQRWAQGRPGAMVRDESVWSNWVTRHWRGARWHTAVWRPSEGAEAEGYLLYQIGEENGKRAFMIKELVALTAAAERGLWGFVANHDSQAKICLVRLQRDYPLWHLVENTHEVQSKLISGWQLRLVDLKAAFEQRAWPGAPDGALTIGVQDEHAPWNTGTWRITFEGGRAEVSPAREERADLAATVQTWAQVYCGFLRPHQALMSGRLEAPNPSALALLSQATADRELLFTEGF